MAITINWLWDLNNTGTRFEKVFFLYMVSPIIQSPIAFRQTNPQRDGSHSQISVTCLIDTTTGSPKWSMDVMKENKGK